MAITAVLLACLLAAGPGPALAAQPLRGGRAARLWRRAEAALNFGQVEPESAQERREEARMNGTSEERALHSAVGAPHEGMGMDSELPATIAEDHVEGENALASVHGLAHNVVMPASAIFLFCLMIGNILSLSKYTSFIPESALILAASIILGMIIKRSVETGYLSMHTFTVVNASLLNLVLLPIIMFNSGWALQKSNFMSQFEYILIFAIFGTLISTFAIGFSSYGLAQMGVHPMGDMRSNFVFAALISAVDPVATLASYAKAGVAATQPLLNIMVFGESAINDAVAIVIFDVINNEWDELDTLKACYQVAFLLFGSILFGIFMSGCLIFLMRIARLPGHTNAEILYIWVSAYFIYSTAESCGVSGIIANLFAGMFFSIYGKQHLAEDGQELATDYLELSGQTADTAVFIMCGTSTAMINSWKGIEYGGIAVVLCLLARGISVPACAAATNFLKVVEGEPFMLTWQHQVAMWHGGLRGGIALVLALEIQATWCQHKGMIINATFVVISALLLILGSSTDILLQKLGFSGQDAGVQEEAAKDKEAAAADDKLVDDKQRMYMRFFHICNHWLTYVLVGPDQEKKLTKKEAKGGSRPPSAR